MGKIKFGVSSDLADLIFRALFCLIFVGLGAEHLFSDALIQHLMPEWMPMKRAVSIACGLWLFGWGMMIFIGYKVHVAAYGLALFLVTVTVLVHMPGVMFRAPNIPEDCYWMWEILQRTNLVKNLCLLGVCFNLLHHELGKYSLESYLRTRSARRG